jgi:UDP-N-acetylmuramate--alanine ligase
LPALRRRRIWFAGIGGAGLSGYAVLAAAWGAEVAGWDRVETPYLAYVRAAGIPVSVAPDPPEPPQGAEVVVSTAFVDRVEGKSRGEFLAELVSLRRSIVVAGAHGKTTTAAMIAFCLVRLGLDPAFLIGGEVPQLGGNARAGEGWLVVEGDESDRTVAALRPEIAVLTNVELDHHATFASPAELEELFERWLEGVPRVVLGGELAPADVPLAVSGEHNRHNAACALAALELAGVARADAARELGEFRGVRRRLEVRGRFDSVLVVDDYGHHPSEIAAALAALREEGVNGRVLVLFQPHLYSRTRHLARELASVLATADVVCVTDVYAAREEPVHGVSGKLVVDALAALRPGMPIGWAPSVEDGARFVQKRARPGDTILTVGAGDVDRAAALLVEQEQ